MRKQDIRFDEDQGKGYMKKIRTAEPESTIFLSLAQDFIYLENPGGYFIIIGINSSLEEAEKSVLRQGQRHPGMVVEILKRDNHPLISSETNFSPLPEFELYVGDGVVFSHGPSIHVYDRIFIYECFNDKEFEATLKAGKTFGPGNVFAFIAKICFLGDSEHGKCLGIRKPGGAGPIEPIPITDDCDRLNSWFLKKDSN